jgi:hypothetical protein
MARWWDTGAVGPRAHPATVHAFAIGERSHCAIARAPLLWQRRGGDSAMGARVAQESACANNTL